jgi:hypothetical protein
VLLVAEVVRQLAVEGALDEGFRELLEQPILTEQVFRLLVVFQEFVKQFGSNGWHNRISFRDCTVDYCHLHRI